MNYDFMKRFEERMEEKKANAPKLIPFEAEFKLTVLAMDEKHASETVSVISKHLERFDDISKAEGKLK